MTVSVFQCGPCARVQGAFHYFRQTLPKTGNRDEQIRPTCCVWTLMLQACQEWHFKLQTSCGQKHTHRSRGTYITSVQPTRKKINKNLTWVDFKDTLCAIQGLQITLDTFPMMFAEVNEILTKLQIFRDESSDLTGGISYLRKTHYCTRALQKYIVFRTLQ